MGTRQTLIPAAPSPGFQKVFGWYNRRLLRRRFSGVLLDRSSEPLAATLDADPRPLVLVLNHSAWWDPLVGIGFAGRYLASRSGIAPMDAAQLKKFQMFRKLGLFGIDPDDPQSLSEMLEYTLSFFRTAPRPTLALTPQGRFVDPREPIRIRPGAAAVCAQAPAARCVSLAIEYAFWLDQRPSIFLRLAEAPAPASPSTAGWHRSIQSTMQANQTALAALVMARDPAPFAPLIDRGGSSINPVYDAYLRLRGRSAAISDRTRPGAEQARTPAAST